MKPHDTNTAAPARARSDDDLCRGVADVTPALDPAVLFVESAMVVVQTNSPIIPSLQQHITDPLGKHRTLNKTNQTPLCLGVFHTPFPVHSFRVRHTCRNEAFV
jgi:hypothetical protein